MFNLTAIREFCPELTCIIPQLSNSSVLYHLPSTPQAIDDGTTLLIEEVAGVHPSFLHGISRLVLLIMATTHSAASDSVDVPGSVFTAERVVNSLPRHDVVKLDEGSFLQWKQQVRFIVNGYNLFGFLDGSIAVPPRFVEAPDGALVVNPVASVYQQQDNLLTSWLLSTISSSILSSFMDVQSAKDVWNMALEMFAADSDQRQSRLRHELHSLKKGSMSI